MSGEVELPPIVIEITASDTKFLLTMAKVTSMLTAWGKRDDTAQANVNTEVSMRKLLKINSLLTVWGKRDANATAGVNTAVGTAKLLKINAALTAWGARDATATANVNTGVAMAKLMAVNKALTAFQNRAPDWPAAVAGGSWLAAANKAAAGQSLAAWLASGAAASDGGGKGGGSSGLLAMLGWGSGKGIGGLLGGMAGFGTPLGLMGFGAEHVVGSSIGILGSLTGALAGGGLLAGGALSAGAVGMGTDMAGLGQAAGDIRDVVTAQNALNQAIAVYGKNSAQAQQAQAQLNYTLSSFSPIARGAVLNAANVAQGFEKLFDKLTGLAEKRGANIWTSFMTTGEKFLPDIGLYAAANMKTIQQGIGGPNGLLSWLGSSANQKIKLPGLGMKTIGTGGLGVFTNLENVFRSQLPTAIKAATQFLEFFAKTMDVAAQYTGHFITVIAKFFTAANKGKAFAGWASTVGKLIGLFRTWLDLGLSLVKMVIALFRPAVGFGAAFAKTLGAIVDQVTKWLSLTSTQKSLHGLFSAHLTEVLSGLGGVIEAILPGLEAMASGFIMVATAGANLAGYILVPLAHLLKIVFSFSIIRSMAKWIAVMWLAWRALNALAAVAAANPIAAAIILIAIAAAEIYAHWHQIWPAIVHVARIAWDAIKAGAKAVAGFIIGVWHDIASVTRAVWGGIASFLGGAWRGIGSVAHMLFGGVSSFFTGIWHTVESTARTVWNALKGFFVTVWHDISGNAGRIWSDLEAFFHTTIGKIVISITAPLLALVLFVVEHWHTIESTTKSIWGSTLTFIESIPGKIMGVFKGAASWLIQAGKDIINGLWNGIKSLVMKPIHAMGSIAHGIMHAITDPLSILSPSRVMQDVGTNIVLGLANGVRDANTKSLTLSHFTNLATTMLTQLKNLVPQFYSAGVALMQGLAQGINSAASQVATAAAQAATNALAASKAATQTHSPSVLFATEGRNWMLGLVQGIQGSQGLVAGALTGTVPRFNPAGGRYGAMGTAPVITIRNDFVIQAGSGSGAEIRDAIGSQGGELMAAQLMKALRSGAGTVYPVSG